MGVDNDWYYSPEAGEICIDVTGLTESQIRVAHKEVEASFALAGGVEIMFVNDPETGVAEWWIYKGSERD